MFRQAFCVPLALFAVNLEGVLANPWTEEGVMGPVHMKPGVIIVYIPKDPLGLGREKAVADSLQPWNDDPTLKALGVNLQPRIGERRPEGQTGGIQVEWSPDPVGPDREPGYFSGDVEANGQLSNAKIELWSHSSQTLDLVLKTSIHEVGHALGHDHPRTAGVQSVMHKRNERTTLSDYDREEIRHAYAQYLRQTKVEIQSGVTPELGLWRYRYDLEWLDGTSLALVQFQINNASIFEVSMPNGWSLDPLEGPSDTEVRLTGAPMSLLSFKVADSSSYLGPSFPILTFSFLANLPPGPGTAFIVGRVPAVVPVPEAEIWTSLIVGFGIVGLGFRVRQARLGGKGALSGM